VLLACFGARVPLSSLAHTLREHPLPSQRKRLLRAAGVCQQDEIWYNIIGGWNFGEFQMELTVIVKGVCVPCVI
jgi:hypothetical protein